jgi:Bacterial protein of unknown function (DUF885)
MRFLLLLCLAAVPANAKPYSDLLTLFSEWRAFQRPQLTGGVPDYRPAAMEAQRKALPAWQARLNDLDPSGWTVPQQVDLRLVRAEMSGLDFDHRVLRPWERNPAFYVTIYPDQSDQPAREGPFAHGGIDLWKYSFPLSAEKAAELNQRLAVIPPLLAQAKGNLTGDGHDLWLYGARSLREQAESLEGLAAKAPEVAGAARTAREATIALAAWVEQQAPAKKGQSGIGIANYDWYLANVQLLPYTWAQEVTLVERELARARESLALEEQKNRALPKQEILDNADAYLKGHQAAITEYMAFLRSARVRTLPDYLEPALRAHIAPYNPKRPLEFFSETDSRDPEVLLTHGYHWFDLARMEKEPHPSPVRRGALLYNIFNNRTEGFATANEELMMRMGMCDARLRSRELVWILLAQRGARALAELKMQANQLTLEEAAKFASANTPRGWLRLGNGTVWFEQHLYLQQPAYGTSYVMGKLEIDKLIAARKEQLGDGFTLQRFMDEFDAAGLIPVPLLRWELAGEANAVP